MNSLKRWGEHEFSKQFPSSLHTGRAVIQTEVGSCAEMAEARSKSSTMLSAKIAQTSNKSIS